MISFVLLVFLLCNTVKMVTGVGADNQRHIWLNNIIKSAFVGLCMNDEFDFFSFVVVRTDSRFVVFVTRSILLHS